MVNPLLPRGLMDHRLAGDYSSFEFVFFTKLVLLFMLALARTSAKDSIGLALSTVALDCELGAFEAMAQLERFGIHHTRAPTRY